MAGERGLEFKVGVLILISSAILIGFIFVLGNLSLRSGFTIYADFDYIGALQPGAIKVSGIKVGKVKDVEFFGGKPTEDGQAVQVRVTAWIEIACATASAATPISSSTPPACSASSTEIVPGRTGSTRHRARAIVHDSHFVLTPRTDLVVARLYEVLDGVSSVLHDDKDAIKHLLANGASAVAEVNQLLVDNRQQMRDLIASGAELAKEAKTTLTKVNAGLGDGKPLANLVADADATIKTARTTMTTITPSATALMTDATRVTGLITEQRVDKAINAADKAATAAGQAGGLIDNVNGMVTDLRAGKGTAGALLSRDELYSDLRELSRDLKRNPWKFFWKE
jgi:ABC-type transporter Mla subunit MlaD